MKKTKLLIATIFLIMSLVACNEDSLLTPEALVPDDLSFGLLSFNDKMGAFAKPSIAQGGYVFTDGKIDKANLEGYPMLNLVHNRWGWAGNLPATTGSTEVPITITNQQFHKVSDMYNLYLGEENPIVVGYVQIMSVRTQLEFWNSAMTSEAIEILVVITNKTYSLSSEDISMEIFDESKSSVIFSKTFNPDDGSNHYLNARNYPDSPNPPLPVAQIPNFSLGHTLNLRLNVPVKLKVDGTLMPSPSILLDGLDGSNIVSIPTYAPPVLTNRYYLIPTIPSMIDVYYGTIDITNDATNLYFNISLLEGYNFIPVEGATIFGFVGNPLIGQAVPINIPFSDLTSPYTSYKLTIPFSEIPQYVLGGLINTKIVCRLNIENTTGNQGAIMPVMGYLNHWWMMGVWLFTNTPTVTATQEFPIYADAGLNDITKGTLVGTAYVTYNGTVAKIKYCLLPEFLMSEVNIYANDAPITTLSPPPYGYKRVFDVPVNEFETILDVPDTNLDNKAWFILHVNVVNL